MKTKSRANQVKLEDDDDLEGSFNGETKDWHELRWFGLLLDHPIITVKSLAILDGSPTLL